MKYICMYAIDFKRESRLKYLQVTLPEILVEWGFRQKVAECLVQREYLLSEGL